jgi:hypothetical protein
LLRTIFARLDATGLLADFGFAPRHGFVSELAERLRLACLPGTPQTDDLGALFRSCFSGPADADWLARPLTTTTNRSAGACADATAARAAVEREPGARRWSSRSSCWPARSVPPACRARCACAWTERCWPTRPFHQVVQAARGAARRSPRCGDDDSARLQQAGYLRARAARRLPRGSRQRARPPRRSTASRSILVFQVDQLRERGERIEALLDLPGQRPGRRRRRRRPGPGPRGPPSFAPSAGRAWCAARPSDAS